MQEKDKLPKRWMMMLSLLTLCIQSTCATQTTWGQSDSLAYRKSFAQATRRAAQQVLPAVVSIEVIGVAQTQPGRQQRSEVAQDAPTCGVVVDPDGFVIASEIVIRRPAASILVVLADSTRLSAKVVARDSHRGLVLLKVNPPSPLTAIEFPSEIDTPVGATVIGVGRYGADNAPLVTSGILSATNRLEGTMLQCDARVSPSYYGGPLIDLYGNPIGILVPAIAQGGAPDETSWYDSGVAFAVPTPVIAEKLDRLKAGEAIKKGIIGIVPKTTDPYAEGTELAAVRSRSPAEKSGIQPGDVVLEVNGQPMRMFQQVKEALGPHDAGETITLKLKRSDKTLDVSVVLADSIPPLQPQRLGVWVQEETDVADETNRLVVTGIVPGTPAADSMQVGDVIKAIGESETTDIDALRRRLITAVPEETLTVSILRQGKPKTIPITPASIGGPLAEETLESWNDQKPASAWEVQPLRLPDVSNAAAYVAPKITPNVTRPEGLAVIALILPAEKRKPEELLQSYKDLASRHGVVVCAISSEEEDRWQSKEIDVVSRLVTLLSQRVEVDSSAVAIAALGVVKDVPASAADSMVIAIALSDRNNFSGIAVAAEAKPPAVRLRENESDRSLQILLPIKTLDDGPTWAAPLSSAGYPIVLGGDVEISDLMRWTRLLQTL